MYFIYLSLFSFLNGHSCFDTNETVTDNAIADVSYIADILLSLLGHDGKNESQRIQELKENLAKIDSYVIDREKYTARLANESKLYSLNATNFYLALNEKDHYRFRNDSRNLYVKLKDKMNRDDLLQILAERGGKKTKKSARRMMQHMPSRRREQALDDAVDKYLGEFAHDDHSFREEDQYSKYWDPEPELRERDENNQQSARRIFKGERTNILYYPFMTSIHIMGRFWCGGALYWNDIVLTSAACLQLLYNNRFYRENPKVLAVRVGSNHSRFGGEMVPALEVFFHPSYNPKTLDNNIAVVRLQRMIKLSYHRVPKLISLSHNAMGVPFTAEVLLLGWGVQKTSQKMAYEPMYLARKFLPVYPNKFCEEVYGDKFNPHNMFCVGTMTTGEGACAHDAGGPAVLAGKVVGIISYGPAICGYPDAPTVLTLVGAFVDWIETINETLPSYYRAKAGTTSSTPDPYLLYFQPKKPDFHRPKLDSPQGKDDVKKEKKSEEEQEKKPKEIKEEEKPVERELKRQGVKEKYNIDEIETSEEGVKEIGEKIRNLKDQKILLQIKEISEIEKIDAKIQEQLNAIKTKASREKKKTIDDNSMQLEEVTTYPISASSSIEHVIKNSEENSKEIDIMPQLEDAQIKQDKRTTKEVVARKIDPLTNTKYRVMELPNEETKNETDNTLVKNEIDISSSLDDNKKAKYAIVKQQSFERSLSEGENTKTPFKKLYEPMKLVDADEGNENNIKPSTVMTEHRRLRSRPTKSNRKKHH